MGPFKRFKPRVTDEYFERVAWICVRENNNGRKEVLFVRSPDGDRFIIPGGRIKQGQDDEITLTEKIKLDISVDLVPDTIRLFTSFGASAYGKDLGVMVGNKYYFADHLGTIQTTPQIYVIKWIPHGADEELTEADTAVMQQLLNEGIINW
jgi:8-oxo-dGTP diphosphatase